MKLTQNYLKECFDYCPKTGVLTWRKRPREHFDSQRGYDTFCGKMVNKKIIYQEKHAGKIYIRVVINKSKYYAHRIIWFYLYGYWPEFIDHINGNGIDNRLKNIRDVNKITNCQNIAIKSDNTSGLMGVCWHRATSKWHVRITISKTVKNIGLYTDFFEACCARKSAENKHGFHKNHGRKS